MAPNPTAGPAPTDVESGEAEPVDNDIDRPGDDEVEAGAAGDVEVVGARLTFDDLYREEYDAMVRVAYLLVGNAETAEEIVQDAFIKVHLRWSRIDTPRAFLRTCVVNGCRDRIRRRVRMRTRMPKLEREAADRATSIDGGDGGPAAELHDVLLTLPLRQRAAIVGRFYGGWDDATIAVVIGVKPATIRSLVHRGLAALRTEIPR
jgi:RNA polymerase sigma factor (sigma-70 family)